MTNRRRGQAPRPGSPGQIIALAFAAGVAVGSGLLLLPMATAGTEPGASALDRIFTATSALCVTGLVTVDTATHWSTSATS